jgi:hypothetical protein
MAHSPNASDIAAPASDDLVLTPGGWRPKSQVHRVEPGQHVSGKAGRLRIIETETGRVVKDLGEVSKEKYSRPRGRTTNLGISAPLSENGWIENSGWTNTSTDPITYFSTTWVVPPPPASQDGQTIYLFNGLEQSGTGAEPNGPFILQPVLQWGTSEAGGGNYWTITNWYANGPGGTALYSSLIQVNSGDVLQGVMTLTGQSGSDYSYLSSFVGYSAADLTVTDIDLLTWACETLECYNISQCSDYPNTIMTAMYGINIKTGNSVATSTDVTPLWEFATSYTDCNQQVTLVSNNNTGGEIDFYFGAPLWIDNDLTNFVNGVPAAARSALDGYWDGNGQHVNYIDANGHVHELYNGPFSNSQWIDNDLTNWANGVPAAAGSALDGYWDGTGQHVNHIDANGHVHELYNGPFSNSQWIDNDLTQWVNLSVPAAAGSALDGYWDGKGQHVNYIDANGNVHELIYGPFSDNQWVDNNLIQLINGVPAAAGSALDGYWDGSGQHVNYIDANGHVHEVYVGAA